MQRRRSTIAAISIALLFWQAIAVLLPAPASARVVDSVLGPILICTSEGVVRLDGADGGGPAPAHSDCLGCLAGGCASKSIIGTWKVVPYASLAIGHRIDIADNRAHTRHLAHAQQARAPPFPC